MELCDALRNINHDHDLIEVVPKTEKEERFPARKLKIIINYQHKCFLIVIEERRKIPNGYIIQMHNSKTNKSKCRFKTN